jgi:hypothetical protein
MERINRCNRGPRRGRGAPSPSRCQQGRRRRRGRRWWRRRRARARRRPVGGRGGAPGVPGRGGPLVSSRPRRRQGGHEGDAAGGRGGPPRRCRARCLAPARDGGRAGATRRLGRRPRRGTRPRQRPLAGGPEPACHVRVTCHCRGGGAAAGSPRAAATDQGMSGLGGRSSSDEWSSSPERKPAVGGAPRAAASDQGMSGLGGRSPSDEWSSSPEPQPGPLPARETLSARSSRLIVPLSSTARAASACPRKVMTQRPRATAASVVRTTSGRSPATAKVSQMWPGWAPLRRPRTSTARSRPSPTAPVPAASTGAGGAVSGRRGEAARRAGSRGGREGRSSSAVAPACRTPGPPPTPKSRATVSAQPWIRRAPCRRQTSSASAAPWKVT